MQSATSTAVSAPRATRREWIGLAVLALPCILYSMDLTVLNLAVPSLSADLKPTSAELLWIVDIYGFLVAGSLITMGTLGDRIGRRKLLLIGAAAFGVAAVLAVIYGLKHIAESGLGWVPALSIFVGIAIGGAFLRRQRRLADPLIDLELFRIPTFSTALAVNILGFSTAFAAFLFIAQYLQSVIGLSPLQAGLWGLPAALSFIAGSMLAPMIVGRFRPAYVIAGGMAVSAAGFVLLALVDNAASPLAMLVAGSVVFSLGLTPVVTLTTDLVLGAAPPERAGTAASMSETSSEFGGALGIAVLGSVVTAVYRSDVADTLPAGISPEAADAARATLGGAAAVAESLPEPLGAALLDAARAAFSQSFELVSGVSAVIAVVIAIVAVTLLRRVHAGSVPGTCNSPHHGSIRRIPKGLPEFASSTTAQSLCGARSGRNFSDSAERPDDWR